MFSSFQSCVAEGGNECCSIRWGSGRSDWRPTASIAARAAFPSAASRCSRLPAGRGPSGWEVRPLTDINRELTARYRLPADVEGKVSGFAFVAGALDNGEIALAQIGALLLRFPDPPRLAKDMAPSADAASLARQLFFIGLLKADAAWVAQHPRTGTRPIRAGSRSCRTSRRRPRRPAPDGRRGRSMSRYGRLRSNLRWIS